ncbi:MAG: hypothetical protein JWR19_244 [Pedosphaera sp.]|nr:hypothetical protein [Pedosphaera sp.]
MNTNNQDKLLNSKGQGKLSLVGTIGVCRNLAAKCNLLKNKVIQKVVKDYSGSVPARLIKQAVVEAEALAWSTPYPMLFLPALAEEKVLSARQRAERQRQILERSNRV